MFKRWLSLRSTYRTLISAEFDHNLLTGEGTEEKYASCVFNTVHLRAKRFALAWQYLIDQMFLPIKRDISFNYTNDGQKVFAA